MIPYNQLSLADIFSNCQDIYESDKPAFLSLLQSHIDFHEFIPASFRKHFYASTGRKRKYPLFALLWALIMGRIDPVECISVSQQRNGNVRNINHSLCGCATIVIQKTPFHYNRGVQATIKERKGNFMVKQTNSLAHTK